MKSLTSKTCQNVEINCVAEVESGGSSNPRRDIPAQIKYAKWECTIF